MPRSNLLLAVVLVVAIAGVPTAASPGQPVPAATSAVTQATPTPSTAVAPPRDTSDSFRTPTEPVIGSPHSLRSPRTEGPATVDGPGIHGVYPNPIHDGDPGEFVLLALPADPRGNWSLQEDGQSIPLPSELSGLVAVTPEPELVRPLIDYPSSRLTGISGWPTTGTPSGYARTKM